MNRSKARTHAGATVGRAVGSGLRTLQHGAVRAGQTIAEHEVPTQRLAETVTDAVTDKVTDAKKELDRRTRRARRKLAAKADTALQEAVKTAEKTTRRARKKARKARRSAAGQVSAVAAELSGRARKRVAKAQKRVAKAQRKMLRAETGKGRRRWPWLVAITAVAAGTVYVVRARSASETEPAEVLPLDVDRQATNGRAPSGTATDQASPAKDESGAGSKN